MRVVLKPVQSFADQQVLAKLAGEIWREFWPSRIGVDQTEYMVKNFQSLDAIVRDMEQHAYEYWFVQADEAACGFVPGDIVGYTGGHVEAETNRFFISKIYLLAAVRGQHICTRIIEHYVELCKSRGLHAMYLTVNKYNELGIRAYAAKGFKTIDAVETQIGEGFIMDDFIMQKTL